MTSDTPELQTIQGFQERLGRLERQNRTLKLVVGAVLILLLVGQYRFEVRERKNPTIMSCNRIIANELVLNDTEGRERARLSALSGYGVLTLYDLFGADHDGSMKLSSTGLSLYAGSWPVVELGGLTSPEPIVRLWGKEKDSLKGISLSAVTEPTLQITDEAGFMSVIGSADLQTPRTGEAHKTSAASLVLFGKDGKVLWSAP